MALKRKITSAEHALLRADLKDEYKKVGDDYILDTEDNDDMAAIRAVSEKEKNDRKAAEARATAAEKAAAKAAEELEAAKLDAANVGKTEMEKLEAKHQRALEKVQREAGEALAKANGQLSSILIDGTAEQISKDLFKFTPDVYAQALIKPRLKIVEKDGKPVTVATGADGAEIPVDDLRKEILANKNYADILKPVGQGSGAGGTGLPAGGQGGGGAKTLTEQHAEEARRLGLK